VIIAEKLEKLSGREKACLVVAVVFILATGIGRFVASPVLAHFKELALDTEKQEAYLTYNMRVLQHEAEVASEYESLKGRFGEVSLPGKAKDELKGQIHELARQTGVTVISSEHREPQSGEFCDEYSVELKQFKAENDQLLAFLYALRDSPGMLRVTKLSLSPAGAQVKGIAGSMIVTKMMIPVSQSR